MKMKKYAIVLLLSLGVFQSAYSQDKTTDDKDDSEETTLNPKFGLKAGYINSNNTADFYGSANATMKSKSGMNFGAFLDIPFSKSWGVQIGMNYAALGTKLTGQYFNITYSDPQNLKYNYFTIPLLAKYTIGNSGLSVLAGPQFGVLLSAKRVNPNGDKTNVKSGLKSNDIAGLGGLEYKLPLKNFSHDIRIGASYQAGLTNIIKDISSNSSNKMYNNAFNAYVAFVF
ncbi:MAG: hypothetical protein DI598_15155 [Pseudopedobacter saltans]|uniref:Outer membrane protein beta-barrel domain-containing protein n=1 Tax=Pseudopedobacter saltans TaxID=151895 RepID=A0A2W5EIE0_9SPHI|nr:MAG: hypothetical protein DI598_15155 [Pseudopedobacter saltans]